MALAEELRDNAPRGCYQPSGFLGQVGNDAPSDGYETSLWPVGLSATGRALVPSPPPSPAKHPETASLATVSRLTGVRFEFTGDP